MNKGEIKKIGSKLFMGVIGFPIYVVIFY